MNTSLVSLASLVDAFNPITPQLRVLTGIARADRWHELRPHTLETVWSLARSLAAVTIVITVLGSHSAAAPPSP